MLRENTKGKPPEVESTDAGYRGGATRSSDEVCVMQMERRDCIDQLYELVNPACGRGGAYE